MEFPTSSGEIVVVDGDMAHLADQVWHYEPDGRGVHRSVWAEGGCVQLHRIVMGCTRGDGFIVDHRDRNQLNNQRSNLRVVTRSQNAQNREPVTRRGTHRGVSFKKSTGRWCARATLDYVTHHLGYFATEEEAVEAVVAWRAEHMTHSDADLVGA